MLKRIKEILASLVERLRKPMEINEGYSRPAGDLKFRFRFDGQTYDVTVFCNERIYMCSYAGVMRYTKKFPIYEVYSVIGGSSMNHEIKHVFDMTIFFPAIGNRFCTTRQQSAIAIDAYISVITQRFKYYIDAARASPA